jgi:exodeoxyribonuclease VIII
MKPGIHENIPFEDYLKIEATSVSTLTPFRRSKLHGRYAIENARKDTPSMKQGRAVHCALLEPKEFENRYCLVRKIDRRTNAGKAEYAAMEAEAGERELLSEDEWDYAQNAANAVREHKTGQILLDGMLSEVTIMWDRPDMEAFRCKGRLDGLNTDIPAIVELKTTQDASAEAFARQIFTLSYYVKAAWYLDGLQALGRPVGDFVFIAVESLPPHGVGFYRLTDEVIELGRKEAKRCLTAYLDSFINPKEGYGDTIKDIAIPQWALNTLESIHGQ